MRSPGSFTAALPLDYRRDAAAVPNLRPPKFAILKGRPRSSEERAVVS